MERQRAYASSLVYKGKEMTNISTERLEEMRRGLEGVTPGPWLADQWGDGSGGDSWIVCSPEIEAVPVKEVVFEKDAEHIAACDPDTIRSMIDELLERRSSNKGEAEPVGKFVTQVSAIDALNDRFYADEDTSPQPNKGEVVELVKKLRLWSETPYEGDPMVDALLGDAADAMSAILSLQRELREARMQALASDGQAQEAWEERGRVENERNQMARDWSEFCEAIGMAVDAHEVVAEAVVAKFAEYALVSQPAPPDEASDKAAIEIGDAVLSWLLKYDLIDAELEYTDDDVIEILDDLAPQPAPKGVEITDEMVERANKASVRVYVPKLSDEDYEQSRKDDPEGFDLTMKAMRAGLAAAMKEASNG